MFQRLLNAIKCGKNIINKVKKYKIVGHNVNF